VIGPRLAGHGISPAAMARTTAADWIASVDEALAKLRETCSQIFMVGLSMGGTLTLYTAAKHADIIQGAVPINAAVQLNSADMAGAALDAHMPATVPGIGSDIKKPGVVELAYKEVPVPAFRQAYALFSVTHDLLPKVTCPVLVIQSRDDHVVDPSNGPRIVRRLGSSRIDLRWLNDSYHVATLDNDLLFLVQHPGSQLVHSVLPASVFDCVVVRRASDDVIQTATTQQRFNYQTTSFRQSPWPHNPSSAIHRR
jgi:carboxylesterase